MANYDIIGGIVSPKALEELKALETMVDDIATKLQGMTIGQAAGKSSDAGLNKTINKLQKEIERLNAAKKQGLTIDQKVEQNSQRLQQKYEAIANSSSKYVTELQKIEARMKLLNIELQKLVASGQTESKAYLDKIAALKKLSTEYDLMAKASGVAQMRNQSMYGATFQLTQVMRELPNFAIDARIGFMSLSNNLPMLVDSFKLLSQQIDATTGKAYGSIGAFKMFAKSLLSVNTIMIVASTLLVLYGKDIVDWISNVSSAEKAQREFIKSLKEGNGEFAKSISEFQRIRAIMESAEKGFISQKDAIDEYNKVFGKTNGYVKTFGEAQNKIKEQTPNYIKAVAMMAYANSILDETVKSIAEQESLRLNKTVTGWQKFMNWLTGSYYGYKSIEESVLAERERKAKDLDVEIQDGITRYQKAFDKFAEFAKKNKLDFFGSETKNDGTVQSGRTAIEKQKYYNSERQALIEEISSWEYYYQRLTLNGEIQSYSDRLMAAAKWFDANIKLHEIDKELKRKDIEEKRKYDLKEIENKEIANKQLYDKGKISLERYSELLSETGLARKTINENSNIELLELADEFNNLNLKLNTDYSKLILSINNEKYEELAKDTESGLNLQASIIKNQYDKIIKDFEKLSVGDAILKVFGFHRDNTIEILKAQSHRDIAIKNAEIKAKQDLMNDPNINGEKRLELEKQIAILQQEIAIENAKTIQDINTEAYKNMSEQIVSTIKTMYDILNQLSDNYFDYQQEKLNLQLESQKNINEEKIKQYELETEAGMHSSDELSDYKDRIAAYQLSQEKENERKSKELERNAFIFSQLIAAGEIWIQYAKANQAINTTAAIMNALIPGSGVAYALTAKGWNLADAIAGTALIAAQTIPMFADGGEMQHSGKAILGDGGKNELAILPDGRMFITPDVPTIYNIPKGTEILPDVNSIDMHTLLGKKQMITLNGSDNKDMILELRDMKKAIKNQKSGNFYGMPLIRQLNQSERFYYRKQSLRN